MSQPLYHVARKGTQLGHFTMEEIREGLRTSRLLPYDHCWKPGMGEWVMLSQIAAPNGPAQAAIAETIHVDGHDANEVEALEMAKSVLVNGEEIVHWAIQRRLFALTHRRQLFVATNNRIIIINRGLLGGFDMVDIRWQDLIDSGLRVGIFGSDLSVKARPATYVLAEGLRKEQAGAIYRHAQSQEQSWREKRRIREMEELRARSGGIHINGGGNPGPSGQSISALDRLNQARQMLASGLISDAEFETIKAKITSEL